MVDIPTQEPMTPEQAFERLQSWYQKQAQLRALRTHEHLERTALAGFYFPSPKEGTNRLDIGGGFDLKLDHKLSYKVSEEDLDQVKAADIKRLKLPWDELFVYKPELKLSVYRKLSTEQKKFVDQVIDIKEASPQLEIVPQADRAGQQAHAAAAEAGNASAPDATGSQEDSSASEDGMVIVQAAEDAQPGQYFNDGDTWWRLSDEWEWEEVEDQEDIDLLTQLADEQSPPEPTPSKRRGRKAATK